MSEALVLREDTGRTCWLTLNRPDKLNALGSQLFHELDRHVETLALAKDDIACVILRGAGRCFSAGHDLGDIGEGETAEQLAFQSGVIERLANLPQAVIAAVHGHCYTGALELALAADIILAAESARFADTHAKWALTPVWGMSQRLPRRVGNGKAREIMLGARTYTGAQAATMGLANACVPDDALEQEVRQWAETIAANSAFSIAACKRLLADTDGMSLTEGLAHEVRNTQGVGPDMEARIAAFHERKRRS